MNKSMGKFFINVELEPENEYEYVATLYERVTGTAEIDKAVYTTEPHVDPISAITDCYHVYLFNYCKDN